MSDKTKKTKNKPKPQANKPQAKKPAVETDGLADAPMLGVSEAPLGTLSADEPAKSMSASEPPKVQTPDAASKGASHKKDKAEKQDQAGADAKPAQPSVLSMEPPADAKPDAFRLPRSAFVGLRKSGGLNFTSREVVVYPDGRVAYDARGVPQKEYTRLRRVMNDGQVIALRKLLDQTNFWMTEGNGEQNPDAFAYEIAATLNHRSHEIEVFDGSIPENLMPLLERLAKFLPE